MSITSIADREFRQDREDGDGGDPLRAATGAQDPVDWYEAAGARIAVSRRGRGPAVVCLHATGHGARDFEALAERIGDRFEVIAVDWPGQGRSPREQKPAGASRYAEILEALLPQLGDRAAIVIGNSIGGAAAIQMAARRPDLLRGLVLCDTGGLVAVDATARFAIRRMTSFFEAGAGGARWFPAAFALYYRLVLPSPAAKSQRDRIVASAREIAPVLAEAWASFGRPEADLRALAPRIACPTLFAWAKQDRVIPWSRCKAAASTFPDARVELFRAGHAAFLEHPDRFAQVFVDFAATLPAAASQSGSAQLTATGSGKVAASA